MRNRDELREEAKILAMIADYVARGRIVPTEQEANMICDLVDSMYRKKIKEGNKKENNEKELGE